MRLAVRTLGAARCCGVIEPAGFRALRDPWCWLEPVSLAVAPPGVRAGIELAAAAVPLPPHDLASPVRPGKLFVADDNYDDQRRPRRAGLALQKPAILRPFLIGAPIEDVLITAVDPDAVRLSGTRVLRPRGCERLDVGVSIAAIVGGAPTPSVIGYAAMLDFMNADTPANQPYLARSFPGHKVISEELVPIDDVPPGDLQVTMLIDGELHQDSSTAHMIVSPQELVGTISARCCLGSGDVVMTGSPDGRPVDQERGWVHPGSIVEGSIEGVGTVTAHIVEEGE